MRFYLGIHRAAWLAHAQVPTFLSARQLRGLRRLPQAAAPWALDSGGFTELSKHGSWRTSAREYVALVRRCVDEIGSLEWAATQDWMCEPAIRERTGFDVATHQTLTLHNYLELRALAPELPWVPVLQGWTLDEYFEHVEAYERAGVALHTLPRVGLGTICRRQHTTRIAFLIRDLAGAGLRLHAFGLKLTGLRSLATHLASADSMAWSFQARRERRGEQNSLATALDWYRALPGVDERPTSSPAPDGGHTSFALHQN
jgi:hypothetical protein